MGCPSDRMYSWLHSVVTVVDVVFDVEMVPTLFVQHVRVQQALQRMRDAFAFVAVML